MTKIVFDCFPDGRRKALSMSYDDGTIHDRRLVDIFNQHGIRGTFHLNSGRLDRDGIISSTEVPQLYAGHEVAGHTVTHPSLPQLSRELVLEEVVEDRRALEQLVGYPVRGFAYPGGDFSDSVVDKLPALGIDYARTTHHNPRFTITEDFLRWPFNCHHGSCLEMAQKFLAVPPLWGLQLLQVMGHSYEFDRAGNWEMIEEFCALMGNRDDIWYATNIEIVDYIRAARSVRQSVDGTMIYNPSGLEVWYSDWSRDHQVGSVAAGATVRL
jgi:hypothetical protein